MVKVHGHQEINEEEVGENFIDPSTTKEGLEVLVCLSGRLNRILRVRAVSIAKSEYFCCLPGLPDFGNFHAFIADGDSQRVREPLFQRDFSY